MSNAVLTKTVFSSFDTVKYEGPTSEKALAYRWYDANRIVIGKPLKEHLRFAVAYWHSLAMRGGDPFGSSTIPRPWFEAGDPIAQAKVQADAAFELFRVLDLPFFCFHDARHRARRRHAWPRPSRTSTPWWIMSKRRCAITPPSCCGEPRIMFSHPRFMAGASTNPDPEVFEWCAATVKNCMDATKRLGGSNYVLWGGREGYETLLNTNMKQELAADGAFPDVGGRLQAQDRL